MPLTRAEVRREQRIFERTVMRAEKADRALYTQEEWNWIVQFRGLTYRVRNLLLRQRAYAETRRLVRHVDDDDP